MTDRVPGWYCEQCGGESAGRGPLGADALELYRAELYNLDSLRFGPWCRTCGARAHLTAPAPGASPETGAILLLNGSCGSGKTTLSRLLADRHGLVQIDGDWVLALLREELRRAPQDAEIEGTLLNMAHGMAWLGRDVVLAHVLLPEAACRCEHYLNAHGLRHLQVTLLPAREALLARVAERRTWPHPTSTYWVDAFQDALLAAGDALPGIRYDNTLGTPEETAEALWALARPYLGPVDIS